MNLRNEIEKVLDDNHCDSCWSDKCYYEEEGGGMGEEICCIHQPEEMATKILSLLEGSLPKETTYESSENHMRGDITDAYTTGWNACLQEIRSKME